jgi:hypothetical protein
VKSCDDKIYKVGAVGAIRSFLKFNAQLVSYLSVNVAGFVFYFIQDSNSK